MIGTTGNRRLTFVDPKELDAHYQIGQVVGPNTLGEFLFVVGVDFQPGKVVLHYRYAGTDLGAALVAAFGYREGWQAGLREELLPT